MLLLRTYASPPPRYGSKRAVAFSIAAEAPGNRHRRRNVDRRCGDARRTRKLGQRLHVRRRSESPLRRQHAIGPGAGTIKFAWRRERRSAQPVVHKSADAVADE